MGIINLFEYLRIMNFLLILYLYVFYYVTTKQVSNRRSEITDNSI